MLPGFRFLFGAIVLCFSILVFGLGAAALFRAAHEEFASRPSWRAAPGTMLAQQNEPFAQQSDSSQAVLALLQVEPDDKEAANETSHAGVQESDLQPPASEAIAAVTEPPTVTPVDAPKLAALGAPEEPSPAAAAEAASNAPSAPEPDRMAHAEPETPRAEGAATVERAAPPVVAGEPETRIAPVNEPTSKIAVASTAASELINAPAVQPGPATPAPKIATLGGSPEAIDTQAREKEASNDARAKAYRNFVRNRLRAQRAAKARRHLAQRARIARRAAVQQRPAATFTGIPATTMTTTNVPAIENPYRF